MSAMPDALADIRRPLLCIGHSHVASVARAALALDIPMKALNFWEMPGAITLEDGVQRLSPPIEQELTQHRGPVFSMIGGAAHNVMGMLVHPRRFDFVLPTQPSLPLDPAAEILPALAVRRVLQSQTAEYLALMSEVRRLCRNDMWHIESPPPYADAGRMHADVPWGMYPGMCREISPAALRYKLWRLHSHIVDEWCREAGVRFVPCPSETIDENGFMLPTYYGDGAHANVSYGERVLEQMRRLV
jgi:hypothetical protein